MRLVYALLALALAGPVRADFIAHPQVFAGPFGIPQTLDFPQFDPALGELTAVQWQGGSSRAALRVALDSERPTPLSSTFQIEPGAQPQVFLPGIGIREFAIFSNPFSLVLGPDDEPGLPPDFAGPDSAIRLVTLNRGLPGFPVGPERFDLFTGEGTVRVTLG